MRPRQVDLCMYVCMCVCMYVCMYVSLGPCTGATARSRRTWGERCISTLDKPERCPRPPHPGSRMPGPPNVPKMEQASRKTCRHGAFLLRDEEVCTGYACCRLSQRINPGSRIQAHKGGTERWETTIASSSGQRLIPQRFWRDAGSLEPLAKQCAVRVASRTLLQVVTGPFDSHAMQGM